MLTNEFITQRLREVATDRRVTVRYANESGSRAWGLASTDSDYDVRFVYQHPREWYLTLSPGRDMIGPIMERDGELDLVGWDLRKFLYHLAGSNAGVLEWLHSPVTYHVEDPFLARLRELAAYHFLPHKAAAHYLGIARGAEKAGYDAATDDWNLKKFCYFMRPILAAHFISLEGKIPPVSFADLLPLIEEKAVRTSIDELIAYKETVGEAHRLPLPAHVLTFFDNLRNAVNERLKQLPIQLTQGGSADEFFRTTIGY